MLDALNKVFRPEFLNRVDGVIVFHALTKEQISQIVDLEVAKVADRLKEHKITLELTDAGRSLLADLGYDPDMGARPLRRVIQNKVEDKLSDGLLAGEFQTGDTILIEADEENKEIVLRRKPGGFASEPQDAPEQALSTH